MSLFLKTSYERLIFHFLQKLNISLTYQTAIESLREHTNTFNFDAMSILLNKYMVSSLVVNLDVKSLIEIPVPAITFIKTHKGQKLIVIEKIDYKSINYYDSVDNKVREQSLNSFLDIWGKTTLLIESYSYSGEDDFIRKNRIQKINRIKKIIFVLSLFLLTIIISCKIGISSTLFLFFAKSIGLLLAILLLRKKDGLPLPILNNVCLRDNTDKCSKVLTSKYSLLFGIFDITKLVFLYFLSGTIALIIAIISKLNAEVSLWLYYFSLCAFPLTLLSVFLQKIIIKEWCFLCLGVSVLIWTELLIGFNNSSTLLDVDAILLLFFSLLIASILSISIFLPRKERTKVFRIKQQLNSITYNYYFIEYLMNLQPKRQVELFNYEIYYVGNHLSREKLIVVIHFDCKSCAELFFRLKYIAKKHEDLAIIIRFGLHKNDDLGIKISCILLQIYREDGIEKMNKALSELFRHKKVDRWLHKYNQTISSSIKDVVKLHIEWNEQVEFNYSPVLIYNNTIVPKMLSPQNFEYFLQKKL